MAEDIFSNTFMEKDFFIEHFMFTATFVGAMYYRGIPGDYSVDDIFVQNQDIKTVLKTNPKFRMYSSLYNDVVGMVVYNYLNSGVIHKKELNDEVARLRFEQSEEEIDSFVSRLLSQFKSGRMRNSSQVDEFLYGIEITPKTASPSTVSFLSRIITDHGFSEAAERLIDSWVMHYKSLNTKVSIFDFINDDDNFPSLHPKIVCARNFLVRSEARQFSIPGALDRVVNGVSSNEDDEYRIFSANPREYVWELLHNLSGDELIDFIECNLKNRSENLSEVRSFAYVHFLEACEIIMNLPSGQDDKGIGEILKQRLLAI